MKKVINMFIKKYQVKGIVQGVGFRPFVYRIAKKYQLNGWVLNDSNGVLIEVEGEQDNITHFIHDIEFNSPELAYVQEVKLIEEQESDNRYSSFNILSSQKHSSRQTLISPDTYVCNECLEELFDPTNRRFRYPFINCTNCGPRYSIIKDIPYDRPYTTMAKFPMCKECDKEYKDILDRRFHAQPNACWKCGPQVQLKTSDGTNVPTDNPIEKTIDLLKKGKILAIKGLGGYHLVVDPMNHEAVKELRKRKKRDEKPFALMSSELDDVKKFAEITKNEEALLVSKERPIVLLNKKKNEYISSDIAPNNNTYGVMLAYTPLHHLILRGNFIALIATSANVSDEPIVYKDVDAIEQLKGIADYYLVHNREIFTRVDDSIVRGIDLDEEITKLQIIRRARGYVPNPIDFKEGSTNVLALGAELKNTICLTKGEKAFISHHIGDLKNYKIYESFKNTIAHLQKIFEISPSVIASDLHPDFYSTKYAFDQNALPVVQVQHHHAHMASCMVDNQLNGPVLGVILDGTGYGDDGNIWGGEFLIGDFLNYQRAAYIDYFQLPGGDKAVKEPYRIALGILTQIYGEQVKELPIKLISERNSFELDVLIKVIQKGINSPLTSSMGRLFDAVSALLGVRETIQYEGQAAIELEQAIDINDSSNPLLSYEIVASNGIRKIDIKPMFKELVSLIIKDKYTKGELSYRFHYTMVQMITETCKQIRQETGINKLVLSGGVFLNKFLLVEAYKSLKACKFEVYMHKQVPTNDGGISLGQAAIAAHRYKDTHSV
ncbi:carbamoyltransferase HypF [Bacillus cereus]|uniref:carbamoyltransferase HypF n=1 Tax=Bacillus cereus TaxID=1396 RepID=UPI003628A562